MSSHYLNRALPSEHHPEVARTRVFVLLGALVLAMFSVLTWGSPAAQAAAGRRQPVQWH